MKNNLAIHFASHFHAIPQTLEAETLLNLAKKGLDKYDLVSTSECIDEFIKTLISVLDIKQPTQLKFINKTLNRKYFKDLNFDIKKELMN